MASTSNEKLRTVLCFALELKVIQPRFDKVKAVSRGVAKLRWQACNETIHFFMLGKKSTVVGSHPHIGGQSMKIVLNPLSTWLGCDLGFVGRVGEDSHFEEVGREKLGERSWA
jgi:hypothetical protein